MTNHIDNYSSNNNNSHNNNTHNLMQHDTNTIIIDWDNISGLDFQYSPCAPVIVVFDLKHPPRHCPPNMSSVVYFLYCSKQDCATYLDGVMLRSDPRLLRLSIQGLPTWSILVNRYSIPIYYSFHFRQFITTIVNIYILI